MLPSGDSSRACWASKLSWGRRSCKSDVILVELSGHKSSRGGGAKVMRV